MILIKSLRIKRTKQVKYIMLGAVALMALVVGIIVILNSLGTTIKVEAGEKIDLCEIFNHDDVTFDVGFKEEMLNHPGKYDCTVLVGKKEKKVKLVVTDTNAPEIKVFDHVYIASTENLPAPEELVREGYDPDGYSGTFLTNMDYSFEMGKTYSLSVRYSDPSGNKTEAFDVKASFIEDKTAPVIEIPDDIVFATDDAISYKSKVNVTDNCLGEVTLEVDDTAVNYQTPGEYKAKITATDISGNSSSVNVTIRIKAGVGFNPSLDNLNKKLATVCSKIISDKMTKEEKCRAVYAYIQKTISYAPTSISDDYIEVAYHALFISGEGDCFSYFAAAKAFLDYLGIENMDIERSEDGVDGTHFWNYVNIGTYDKPAWYHFDCTELSYEYNETGCLLTNAQVKAYDEWRHDALGTNFRQYDKSKYPKAAIEQITETPNLKDYMD